MFAAIADWIPEAPISFVLGVGAGMALASRFRITRAKPPNTSEDDAS